MLEEQFKVRFYETDALGHVNNTVIPGWIETGRLPIFDFFGAMSGETISLIVARLEVDYLRPIYFGKPVTVKTFVMRLGNSSFDIGTEVWQDDQCCAMGKTILVYFDYSEQKATPLTADIKQKLSALAHPEYPIDA
ncbi:thioesterase [Idiomarina tyrosinivorans]|uniref:Thioesterase n=1 Tax=Idiomarina tyrosinivorans TaxID=1445662 RepID=A0A432ZQI6_9GAMM|nr:thioesterase family protein [Idiomarina tyrosinivorans]RUO80160.1 thioesterase [Idiomarina tyrosinivorans]